MTLATGESTEVQGSAAKPYIVKNHDGVVWSCSCPAWKNSGGAVEKKTCKHIRQVAGASAEAARLAGGVNPVAAPSAPAQSTTAATPLSIEKQEIIARAESQGRKLRQDEKVKLNGPPVLLANHFEDENVDPAGWWWSAKLDGCRAFWDGSQFISRQGNTFQAPAFFKDGLPDYPLDGELYLGLQSFQKTMSIVRRLDGGDLWKQIKFVVFDAPQLKLPFEKRMDFLSSWFAANNPQYAILHTQSRVQDRAHLMELLEEHVSRGEEGLMLRKPGSMYEVGRSSTLLKVKKFLDTEGLVIGHEKGKGKHKGRLGSLRIQMPNGKEFSLGTGLTDAERNNPPSIGSTVTYSFTELTSEGLPKCAAYLRLRVEE